MSNKAENNPATDNPNAAAEKIPRLASKKSVDRAIDLIRAKAREKLARKRKLRPVEKGSMIINCCVRSYIKPLRKAHVATAFCKTFIPVELINAFRCEDWVSVFQLLLIFLRCNYAEPPVWKYMFLIHMASPARNQAQFDSFLERNLGSNYNSFLEKMLSLRLDDAVNEKEADEDDE